MLPVLAGAATYGVAAAAATTVAGCPVFPASDPWNQDISKAPVAARSDAYVKSIGLDARVHPDFASKAYGIPFKVVAKAQKKVPIHFTDYGDESDKGPYPVPLSAPVEGGSDRHVIVLQRGTCKLYELFGAHRSGNSWSASNGARFDLKTGRLRPKGWTSADAAGLPIFPGLARADEVIGGRRAITHALRVTVPRTQKGFISPARHFASSDADPDLPPMGLRLRLKASFDITRFHGQARVILTALKRYGLIVADNGSPWYITGAPDRRWSDENLHTLGQVPGSAFEAVQTGAISR